LWVEPIQPDDDHESTTRPVPVYAIARPELPPDHGAQTGLGAKLALIQVLSPTATSSPALTPIGDYLGRRRSSPKVEPRGAKPFSVRSMAEVA